MRRVAILVLLGAVCVGAALLPVPTPRAGGRPAPVLERSCKPSGPVALEIVPLAEDGARIELLLRVRPVRALSALRWELELPADAVLVEGAVGGLAAKERGALTEQRVVLAWPADGAFRRVALAVEGAFEGSDGTGATFDEPFGARRELAWGERPDPAPRRATPDAEGSLFEVVALPTAHRSGR